MTRQDNRRFARLGIGSLWLSLLAAPAAAQTDSAAARALFSEGRELMQAERFGEACPKLEESLRLDHGMGTQFNLAHCWEKLGRSASAWALFLDVAAAARAGNQPQRETAARERATALEPKLTRLRVDVPTPTPGMKVARDDQDVGRAAWGTAMPVDPGEHRLVVTAPGRREWTHELDLPATAKTFSVTVPELEEEDVSSVAESDASLARQADNSRTFSADAGSTRDKGEGRKVAALVVGGAGVALVAVGTIFALKSRSDNAEALKLCRVPSNDGGPDTCLTPAEDERHGTLVDDAKKWQLLAIGGFAVGGAALITATILLVTGGDDTDPGSPRAVRFDPLLGEGNWGATLSGRF
jgi:hypothetical protein